MLKIYIAGPMTGRPEFNFPAFHAAAAEWRKCGWAVHNPAEAFDGRTDLSYSNYVQTDLVHLKTCDAIAMLPGWDDPDSRGAVWEYWIARLMLNIPTFDATRPAPAGSPYLTLANPCLSRSLST